MLDTDFHFLAAHSSRRFELCDAILNGRVMVNGGKSGGGYRPMLETPRDCEIYARPFRAPYCSSFVIQHNWAAALTKALGDFITPRPDDKWKAPCPVSCFEFRIEPPDKEAHIAHAIFAAQDFTNSPIRAFAALELFLATPARPGQFLLVAGSTGDTMVEASRKLLVKEGGTREDSLLRSCLLFVRAACIAMDINFAETESVEVPPKLAAARMKRGKPPMLAYKIIHVTRNRPCKAGSGETGRKLRAHPRRGHYWPKESNTKSRFAGFRHWRPWQIVGDPDLGFIEHDYKI